MPPLPVLHGDSAQLEGLQQCQFSAPQGLHTLSAPAWEYVQSKMLQQCLHSHPGASHCWSPLRLHFSPVCRCCMATGMHAGSKRVLDLSCSPDEAHDMWGRCLTQVDICQKEHDEGVHSESFASCGDCEATCAMLVSSNMILEWEKREALTSGRRQ